MNFYIKHLKLTLVLVALVSFTLELLYFNHCIGNYFGILFLALFIISSPAIILALKGRFRISLLLILLCSFFYQGIYWLFSRDFSYIPTHDALFHLQNVDIIMSDSRISFGKGIEVGSSAWFYSFYPGMHVFLAIFSKVTSIHSVTLVKLFPFICTLSPLLVYLFTRAIFQCEKVSLIAAFVHLFNPSDYPVTSYRYFGLIFLLAFLYSYSSLKKGSRQRIICTSVFLFALSITHHVTLYITLGLLLALYALNRMSLPFITYKPKHPRTPNILLFLLIGIFWSTFVGYMVLLRHVNFFRFWFLQTPWFEKSIVVMRGYSASEQYFNMAIISTMLVLGFLGFFKYAKTKCDRRFIAILFYFSLLFFVFFIARNINDAVENLARRQWSFLFLGISPLVGYVLISDGTFQRLRIIKSIGLVVLLCLPLTCMSLSKAYFDFRFENETGVSTHMRGYGERVYSSVYWYKLYSNGKWEAVGDTRIRIFGQSLNCSFSTPIPWVIYTNPPSGKDLTVLGSQSGVLYIFVNHLSGMYGQYSGWKEYIDKVPKSNLIRLSTSEDLDRIYDNVLVQIMQINPH